MFNKRKPQHARALIAALVLSGVSTGISADDAQMLSAADLPAVPISITSPKRQPASAPVDQAKTATAQAEAGVKVSKREKQIAEMKAQVAALQKNAGNVEQAPQAGAEVSAELEKKLRKAQQQEVITLTPGVNQILSISRGHPNRIIAPFANPEVRTTTSDAEITTSGEIIYVATGSQNPVTVFISPKGNERVAASITLLPQSIPPQEIRFKMDVGDQVIKYANPTAEQWETRGSYVDTITEAFRSLALQDLPQGFTMRTPKATDVLTCFAGKNVKFELGQVVEGHNMEIQIAVATNIGGQPVEIVGSQCAGYRTLAAAEWPHSVLEPGQKTEVFVAIQRLEDAEPEIRRPSLIQE